LSRAELSETELFGAGSSEAQPSEALPSEAQPSEAGSAAHDPVDAALRALRHRDLTEAGLERRLAAKGFGESERQHALATLRRTGIVDDGRFAEARAARLAGRGAGDALVRADLARAGVSSELIEDALSGLPPEAERARGIVERRGAGPKTSRYLSAKGFSDDTVAALGGTT
jgi:regulatory protein